MMNRIDHVVTFDPRGEDNSVPKNRHRMLAFHPLGERM
jgi:hypothetical protein